MTYSAMYGGRSGRAKGKAPKGKKSKCALCDAKGHTADECPNVYKDPSNPLDKALAAKTPLGFGHTHKTSRKARGSKDNSNNNNCSTNGGEGGGTAALSTWLAKVFPQSELDRDPFYCLDAGCDSAASLDSLATLQGSSKKGKATLAVALDNPLYGACLCRVALKPPDTTSNNYSNNNTTENKNNSCCWDPQAPRIAMILEADPHTLFVVGLGPGFLNSQHNNPTIDSSSSSSSHDKNEDNTTNHSTGHSDKEMNHAVDCLVTAWRQDQSSFDDNRIVGFGHTLDYSPDTVQLHGYDRASQLNRLRATCMAALRVQIPIQCRISPGAPAAPGGVTVTDDCNDDNNKDNVEDAAAAAANYVQVVKDLASVLLEMSSSSPALTMDASSAFEKDTIATKNCNDPSLPGDRPLLYIHLSCWNGTEAHMMHLLQAFPDTLYIGMNASAGFQKNKNAHECAFSVPLDRLLLESDAPHTIPAPVVAALGRKAFNHSGTIPFVAAAVADQKRNEFTPVQVARTASRNTVRLYAAGASQHQEQRQQSRSNGFRLVERAAQAAVAASSRAQAAAEKEQNEQQDPNGENAEDDWLAQQLLEDMATMSMET